MRLSWQIRPLEGGGWEGYIEIPWGPSGSLDVRSRAGSPGEALEHVLTRAQRVMAAGEVSGFIPIGDIFSTVLSTAGDVARAIGGATRRGEPPPSSATALPGPLAKVASISAMRPGGYGPPPGMPGPWAWAPPGYAPPGWGAPSA